MHTFRLVSIFTSFVSFVSSAPHESRSLPHQLGKRILSDFEDWNAGDPN